MQDIISCIESHEIIIDSSGTPWARPLVFEVPLITVHYSTRQYEVHLESSLWQVIFSSEINTTGAEYWRPILTLAEGKCDNQ